MCRPSGSFYYFTIRELSGRQEKGRPNREKRKFAKSRKSTAISQFKVEYKQQQHATAKKRL
jgi:hypothetical protein